MPLRNSRNSYGQITKSFHWLIALLVVLMLILGASLDDFSEPAKIILINVHKSIGLTILLLMILRFFWRLSNPIPALPATTATWEKIVVRASHLLWYVCLIAMPLTGWMMSTAAGKLPNFWWIAKIGVPGIPQSKPLAETISNIHTILAWVITALLVFHILGALKHQFIDKDFVLKRMLPLSNKKTPV